MTDTPYRCECATCGTERMVRSYESANEFFHEHAERGHEVEIVLLDEPRPAPEPE